MEVKRIVPNLASADPKASREFYASFLGLRIGMDMGWITTFVSTSHPSAQVSVCPGETERTGCSSLSIEVDDVDAAHREALARGYEVVYPLTDEPWGVRRFCVTDPSGLLINVMSHRPRETVK